MRYDACVIGAGAEGLAAAATLAKKGLKVFVVERHTRCGGRCVTREFHPGHFAAPYTDELPAVPPEIFWSLDLARHGALFAPAPSSLALWPDKRSLFLPWTGKPAFLQTIETVRAAIIARVLADAGRAPPRGLFGKEAPQSAWPGEELAARSLNELLEEAAPDPTERAHLLALAGRMCDPGLAGGALTVLAGIERGGVVAGGLGRLGDALRAAAEAAGAEISCGLEAADVKRTNGRVTGVGLADGAEIAARAVISTLDLRRTILSLFSWSDMPRSVVRRVGGFRAAPGVARLLVALKTMPEPPAGLDASVFRGPIHLSPDPLRFEEAYHAWRRGNVPDAPPATLRVTSASDPTQAPIGAATVTLTLAGIPHLPFDTGWTREKRDGLRDIALDLLEEALPGSLERLVADELIVPPDMEDALGITEGDLWGGELAADQMLSFRPFADCRGGRTPVAGLYLAGSSSALGPLATCASGVAAARALLADLAAGWIK